MPNKLLTDKVLTKLRDWAQLTHAQIGTDGIYVFGSLIRRGGVQFDAKSDVDLLITIPEAKQTPWERAKWIEELCHYKKILELDLMMLLTRVNAGEVISSVVAVTALEVEADIHKDGAVGFFSVNTFRSLLDDTEHQGLPTAGTVRDAERLVIECFKFAQKKRNAFLGVSPNGTELLTPFDGEDPLPKDIMRCAAMARQLTRPSNISEADTDTQRGLDFLTHHLYEFETLNEEYQKLQNDVSVRRGARGVELSISSLQQLLLSEIIFDSAMRHTVDAAAARINAKQLASKSLPSINGLHSTAFFSDRFAQAFPGSRGIEWFDDPEEIRIRLNRLFKVPLQFLETTPIWWWRNSNLQISRFLDVGHGEYLMNNEELRIKKIAAVHGGQYYRSFVYIEVGAMEPTGLYASTPARISAVTPGEGNFGYYWEEYGLVDGIYKITNAELDDGAAKIEGQLQDTVGRAESRSRYVTPYNFVVAAHDSAISNPAFDRELERILNGMLRGVATLDDLEAAARTLPKRH